MDELHTVDPHTPGVADVFDELPLWSAPFGLALLDRVPLRRGATYLDVGAGTGFLSIELAQRCGPESRIIAVDPWPGAVERFRRKLEHLVLSNVAVHQEDVLKVDLVDDSIDVIVSNLGINNFEDPAATMRRMHRVARAGATLVLTTNLSGHMAEFYDVLRETLITRGLRVALPALDAHVAHRGTLESTSALVREAGFEITETATDSFRLRYADGTALLRHWFIRLGFLAGWVALIPEPERAATLIALARNLDAVAAEAGELVLTIPTACVVARKR